MTKALATAVAGALTLVWVTACGSVVQPGRGPTQTFPAPTSTSTPTTPTAARTSMQSTIRIRGTVSDGVEPGCMLLTSKGVVYLLLWRHKTPVTGPEIEVEGTLQPDLLTTCQQGIPLVVDRVVSP